MSTWSTPQRIWLTGATSGIGKALATKLLAEGHQLALSARNADALAELSEGFPDALVLPLDISDRQAVLAAGRRIEARFGALDLALFNAGTCEYLDAQNFDMALIERVFTPNVYGTLCCVEAALPLLRRARGEGRPARLAAVSSAAAYLPLPRAEAYGASKAALSHFLESLRLDLHGEGIAVSVIHPGFVKTPLSDRNDFPMPMRISPEQAAEAILAGLARGRLDIHFPRRFTYLVKLLGILPATLRLRIGLRMVRDTSSTQEKRS
ncbi:SDR family NAD(P)-dependent oxidoreductase [Halomonas sediminis]